MKPIPLKSNTAHFYAVKWASLSNECVGLLNRALTPMDHERLNKLRQSADKKRFVVARGGLRLLTGTFCNQDIASADIGFSEKGKPFWPHASQLQFNVSHSGDWVVLGFAHDREIGVDVQEMRNISDLAAMSRTAFHPDEQAVFGGLKSDAKINQAFYQIWSLREAGLKSVGAGLFALRTQYSVLPLPCDDWEFRTFSGDAPTTKLVTKQIDLAENYTAAVAVVGNAAVKLTEFNTKEFEQIISA
jgi:4'-phosphopantetheinyl transferase